MGVRDDFGNNSGGNKKSRFFFTGGDAVDHDSAAVLVDAVDLSILDANPQAATLLGRSVADLAGQVLPDLIDSRRTEDGIASVGPAPVCYRLTGINGESISVVTADDLCNSSQAVTAANTLVSENVTAVVGHICSRRIS